MAVRSDQETADLIIGEVLRIIESDGYEAVELRGVARRTHLSLATIYRLFPSREDLIIAAVETWMAGNSWSDLAGPKDGETVYDAITRILRQVFEPWERNPRALEAYYRALESPKGKRLQAQTNAFGAMFRSALDDKSSAYVDDLKVILTHVTFGVIATFVKGELDIADVLPTLERAVFRLTTDNQPDAQRTVSAWSDANPVEETSAAVISRAEG